MIGVFHAYREEAGPVRRDIIFNGRFLGATQTGVQRGAAALITHLDAILAREPARAAGRQFRLYHPASATRRLPLTQIEARPVGVLGSQFWEQLELPLQTRGQLLVNLCNLAPLGPRGNVTMIHDAQVFETPDSYGRAFVYWYRFALPRIGAAAGRILTVSNFSREALIRYGVASPERITVIPNGADHLQGVRAEHGIVGALGLQPRRYVLAVASTQAHKNIAVLLRAFALPALADLKLVLFGGADEAEFRSAGLAPPANVVFAGRIGDGALLGLMEEALCLAFPSRTEGFGLPPLEAMMMGCPAVVAPCGALPESCGDAALYVDPDDAAGWTDAISALAADPALRHTLSLRGRAHAGRFTWAASAARLLDVLLQVADGVPHDPHA
jgi:glycosyltransferase involved in cell wall biosynthesis